jgi:hypothetical protein
VVVVFGEGAMLSVHGRTLAAVLVVAGGIGLAGAAQAMELSVSWAGTAKCFDPQSPTMTVKGAPKGTVKLRFVMNDLDAPGFEHGGGTVASSGGAIAKGAFSYKGPCPPKPHRYRMTVWALDAAGKELAKAATVKVFPE